MELKVKGKNNDRYVSINTIKHEESVLFSVFTLFFVSVLRSHQITTAPPVCTMVKADKFQSEPADGHMQDILQELRGPRGYIRSYGISIYESPLF